MKNSNGKRVIISHHFTDGKRTLMRYDDLGLNRNGDKVSAITDAAGAQVLILGRSTHLISQPLSSHQAAITLGEQVLRDGPEVYPAWRDLHNRVAQLVRTFLES